MMFVLEQHNITVIVGGASVCFAINCLSQDDFIMLLHQTLIHNTNMEILRCSHKLYGVHSQPCIQC